MSTQTATQTGHHNIIVQASGDNIHIQVGVPHLKLIPVEARIRKQLKREVDILNPTFQKIFADRTRREHAIFVAIAFSELAA
jgi:hypothetical protein